MYLYTILKGTVPERKRMASSQTVHHTYERLLQNNFYSAQMSQEYIITNDTKLKTMTMTKRDRIILERNSQRCTRVMRTIKVLSIQNE